MASSSTTEDIISMLKNQAAEYNGGKEICEYKVSLQCGEDVDKASIMPHWRNFVEAIRTSNPENQYWYFDQVHLSPEMVNILQPLMVKRNIHTLKINRGFIDDEVCCLAVYDLVCEVLEKNVLPSTARPNLGTVCSER